MNVNVLSSEGKFQRGGGRGIWEVETKLLSVMHFHQYKPVEDLVTVFNTGIF
jgi:hypothetical protein